MQVDAFVYKILQDLSHQIEDVKKSDRFVPVSKRLYETTVRMAEILPTAACTTTLPFLIAILTLSVPVSYQQSTSPYITLTKYNIW